MRTKLRSKISLLFIVCAALLAFAGTAMALTADPSGNTAPSPTISSDKADYAPGELVTLSGGNWQPGESVNIKVNDTYGASWSRNVDVTADASGNITDQFNLPDSFVSDYDVTATGSSGTATTSFTDGNVTYSPTRLPATGLQAVTAGNSVNLAPDVTLTKTGGGADPVVNTPITVTNKTTGSLTGQTCGGAGTAIPSSWLSVASPTLPQTITTSQNVTFRVSPPANASAGTYTGAVELANSTTNNTNAVDVCLNVSAAPTAVNTTTTASSTTATYGNSSATLNANVSPASGPAVGSGTVTFTVKKGATTIGTVTSGTVSAGSASANFPLSGVNADTYTIEAAYNAGTGFNASNNSTQSPTPTLTVNKKAITVTPDSGQSKVYGQADPTLTYSSSPALESGDSFSGALSRAPGNNVGNYAINLGTLSAGTNYNLNLSATPVNFEITAKSITITPDSVQSKVYGQADPTLTYSSSPALESGDSFSGALSRAPGNNVGNYAINLGTLSAGTNYNLNLSATPVNFAITAKALTISGLSAQNKVYDGNATATITGSPSLVGVISPDNVSLSGTASGTFNNASVGDNKPVAVSGLSLAGAGAGNYSLTPLVLSANITAWNFSGFYQPIDMLDSMGDPVVNTVKNGATVPFKFELFAGNELTSTTSINQPLTAKSINCATLAGDTEDPIELTATGGTVLRYDTTGGQFIYNWQTPKKVGTCYAVTITANDGSFKTAYFKLK